MVVKLGQFIASGSVRKFARLLALPRMGSFNAAPKIINDDCQDQDIQIPEEITRNELLRHCQRMTGHASLKRTMEGSGASVDRASNPQLLRIFQWNVLSQGKVLLHMNFHVAALVGKFRFVPFVTGRPLDEFDSSIPRALETKIYTPYIFTPLGVGNDNFVKCPYAALDWNYRRFKIIEEIIQYTPDIICLQEVDHFNFLKHILGTQGYCGVFFPKPDSPCIYLSGNNGPDGCAIFFKLDKFNLINVKTRILEIWRVQSNQVALLANLEIKATGQEICVTTTHLKARQGALLSALRNEQGKDLLQFVVDNSGGRPVIISGDFNAEPIEPIYGTILNDKLNLGSAYCDISSREPEYTTWKIRDEGEVCHTIDYVFYKKSDFEVNSILNLPTEKEIGEDRVPSLLYPSDHFSLVCDLTMKHKSTL